MILPALTEAKSPYWRPIKYSLFPPLGLATLAGYLDEADEVIIQDEHVETLDLDDEPDLVAIEVYITSARRAYELADHHRAKGAHVALGGLHVTALPGWPAQKSAIEPAPASDAPPAATGDSIGAQVQMIDSARRQLGAGNASGALEQLDRYRQKYPQGMLGQEATLLRIEALAQGGNRAAARQLARRYLANHPNSQYSKRIQSLIGERKSDGLKPPEP